MKRRRTSGRRSGAKREPSREKRAEERHGPDWETGGPEWAPPAAPGEAPPGTGAEGEDPRTRPAKVGDPPIEEPPGERSRRGGRLPGAED